MVQLFIRMNGKHIHLFLEKLKITIINQLIIQIILKVHFKGTFSTASRRFFATFMLMLRNEKADEQVSPQ